METKQKRTKVVINLLAIAGLLVFSLLALGGDLEPSGPPGPTMKTLDEVEPRIPISQADFPKTISSSGSYYFTEDVSATGVAITVNVNDVTIDLAGFVLSGPDSGISYGIYMDKRSNVEIRNGTVRDFRYGIIAAGASGHDHRVINVRALSNGRHGIYLDGKGHLVKNCTASNNGDSAAVTVLFPVYGIYAGSGSTVIGNTANNNGKSATGEGVTEVYGICALNGCTVTGNTANGNGNSANVATIVGIYAGNGSTVTGNTVRNNGISASTWIYGLIASNGCTVIGNTAYGNGDSALGSVVDGIHVSVGCTVIGNTARSNGRLAGSVYGIFLSGDNFVDQNTASDNDGTNMDTTLIDCTYGKNHAP